MFAESKSRVRSGLIALLVLLVALALPVGAEEAEDVGASTEFPRLEALRERARAGAERLGDATPAERELRRELMLERLREATPAERRRILRRERRLMLLLPEDERRVIREENRAFRKKHGLLEPETRRELARELELSGEDRRLLRARFRELPREERRELWGRIQRFRSLSPEEREALRARLNEMKSLSEEERQALRERAQRWSQMSEEKREQLREQMRRLRALDPEERAELLERALDASESGTR